ncbi:MAG TPA: hypothetical protein VMT18_14365, partial [Planctomycetota bacterium]|nr:hypothetical protein [Planctomycetota bacterium]
MLHLLQLTLMLLAFAPAAAAQDFNVRLGEAPTPSPAFGAAIRQEGVWNAVPLPNSITPLLDLTGNPTTASCKTSLDDAPSCPVTGYGSDIEDFFAGAGEEFYAVGGIVLYDVLPGAYIVQGYALTCIPQSWNLYQFLKLSDGTYSSQQVIGGPYLGDFDAMSLATFQFHLNPSVKIQIEGWGPGFIGGLQLTRIEPPQVYCTSKVNSQGCAAKIAAIGNSASLSGAQPFHIVATDVVNDVPGLLFYGFAADVKPFMG